MSLDVYLQEQDATLAQSPLHAIPIRDHGQIRYITQDEWDKRFPGVEPWSVSHDPITLYWANITHNLGMMAAEAGIYNELWHPENVGISTAHELIDPLMEGLSRLAKNPDHYKQFNPSNGWGDYEGLVKFIRDYIEACHKYPNASVRTST